MVGFHGEAFVQMDCKYKTRFSICKRFVHKYSIFYRLWPFSSAKRWFSGLNAVQMGCGPELQSISERLYLLGSCFVSKFAMCLIPIGYEKSNSALVMPAGGNRYSG